MRTVTAAAWMDTRGVDRWLRRSCGKQTRARLRRATASSRFRVLPAVAAFALAGCTHTPPVRYVSTACLTSEQLNALKAQEPPKIRSLLNGDAEHDLKLIAGNDIRMRAWAEGLLTVLSGCTGK